MSLGGASVLFSIIIPIGESLSRDRLAGCLFQNLDALGVRFCGCIRDISEPRKHLIQFNESNLRHGIALLSRHGIEAVPV